MHPVHDQRFDSLQQAAGVDPVRESQPRPQSVQGVPQLGQGGNDERGLVQRGVIQTEYLRPPMVDLVVFEPADTPHRGLGNTVLVEEPRL